MRACVASVVEDRPTERSGIGFAESRARLRAGSGDELGVVDEDACGAVVSAAAEEVGAAASEGEGGDEIEAKGAAGERGGDGSVGAVVEGEGDVEDGVAGVGVDGEGAQAADFDRAGGG